MTITEIENLTSAELKERKPAILESLKTESVVTLAERYFLARLDAKMRDEKLAQQGRLITELQAKASNLTKK